MIRYALALNRFFTVAAIGVPIMEQPPVPPTQIFPQTEDTFFYTFYFQVEGVAEKEFEADIRRTFLKIYYAASAGVGLRLEGDGTPNPFGMVSRNHGLLASLPMPDFDLPWLTAGNLAVFVSDYAGSGFRGGLNLNRNLDCYWGFVRHLQVSGPGARPLYGRHSRSRPFDAGRAADERRTKGPRPTREPIFLDGCGHWAPQEQSTKVSEVLVRFLAELTPQEQRF
ncbi:alpha/beta hydrolase fold protein [Nitratireductor aquibiodomus RA22]|uniref:Alpha/beta hydrolase fold protein n=1 Tax=Nitratireductor aquibiodomus RA22 TaxID=1189611 RepID=I5BQP6_9HYPH|nr:hypothetical protein [Nitratireductor aquibiodomus]EIM71898.1 alpha/beta hydrolase fold protein [Nitratireductor aquibiodomus RA22]